MASSELKCLLWPSPYLAATELICDTDAQSPAQEWEAGDSYVLPPGHGAWLEGHGVAGVQPHAVADGRSGIQHHLQRP